MKQQTWQEALALYKVSKGKKKEKLGEQIQRHIGVVIDSFKNNKDVYKKNPQLLEKMNKALDLEKRKYELRMKFPFVVHPTYAFEKEQDWVNILRDEWEMGFRIKEKQFQDQITLIENQSKQIEEQAREAIEELKLFSEAGFELEIPSFEKGDKDYIG